MKFSELESKIMDQPDKDFSPRRSSRLTSAQKINYKEERDYSETRRRRSEPKINTKAFLEAQNNPGKDFSRRVVEDVIADLRKDFEENNVPDEVLTLLEQTWLKKLALGPAESPKPTKKSAKSPKPTKKSKRGKNKKKSEDSGLESSSSSDKVEAIDKSDTADEEDSEYALGKKNWIVLIDFDKLI